MDKQESLGAVHTHTHTHTHTGKLKEKIKITLIIITILLIILLCFNVGAYATYVLSATDVSYTKSNGTTVNVAYDAGNNHSYTSPKGTGSSHGNGNGNQTFTSSSSVKWRVLGWDDETGGVMLISEEPIGRFSLNGAVGYLYAEQELNEICKIYGYGTGANISKKFNYVTGDTVEGTTIGTITGSGARSINVDDVNKICGVTPSTTLNSNYGKALYTKSIYYPTSQSTGKSTSATSRTDVYTYYKYTVSDYLSETTEVYKMLFRDTANSNSIGYWLASRCVLSTPSFSDFDVHFTNSGCVDSYTLGVGLSSSLNQISRGLGVRPIVFLKSNLQTNGKNSSGAWNIIDK